MQVVSNNTIHLINSEGEVLSVYRDCFNVSNNRFSKELLDLHKDLKESLKNEGIDYYSLRNSLVPKTDSEEKEICLIYDTSKINDSWYGKVIFNELIEKFDLFHEQFCVCSGDFLDILNTSKSKEILKNLLFENLIRYNDTNFTIPNQYYLIYIRPIKNKKIEELINRISKNEFFVGYIDTTFESGFKKYISLILVQSFIKYKKFIIQQSESDKVEHNNIYNFKFKNYKFKNIPEIQYLIFLNIKISDLIEDKNEYDTDMLSITSGIIPNIVDNIILADEKWEYLLENKLDQIKKLELKEVEKNLFLEKVKSLIKDRRIYNINYKELENGKMLYLFDVFFEYVGKLKTNKFRLAFEYLPDDNIFKITTFY